MKKQILVFILLHSVYFIQAQELISYELINSKSQSQVEAEINYDVLSGVDYYKLVYSLIDHNNQLDTASGLVTFPKDINTPVPLVAYQHGTTSGRDDVPSNLDAGSLEAMVFASQGFVCSAADYIGMGDSDGFHPYIHAASEAAAGVYFIKAAQELCDELGRDLRPELFVSGYSQGGHAGMALQSEIEQNWIGDLQLTACGHGSGPYSVSEIMRLQMLADESYVAGVAFIPYVILSYQEVYGNLYSEMNEFFKAPYIPDILRFYNNEITLSSMGFNLGFLLLGNEGLNARVYHMLQDSITDRLIANVPADPIIAALRANDTYKWQASTPTKLYYCEADEQVPFENALFADSAMNALGANDLEAVLVDVNADHGECANQAFPLIVDYFNSFLQVGTVESELNPRDNITIYPNPSKDEIMVEYANGYHYEIISMEGSKRQSGKIKQSEAQIALHELPPGQYFIRFIDGDKVQMKPLIKMD
jgi:hypothetical protein